MDFKNFLVIKIFFIVLVCFEFMICRLVVNWNFLCLVLDIKIVKGKNKVLFILKGKYNMGVFIYF